MKNIFREVSNSLRSLYGCQVEGHALGRINTLTGMITGMINKGESSLNALGSGLPQDIDASSRETHAKRFLENEHTDYKVHFLPYLRPLLRGILASFDPKEGIYLAIDGSTMGNKHIALMVSLIVNKRAIPICWFVKEGKKGHFDEQAHLDVVQQAAHILTPILKKRPKMPVTLVGDGEFDGVELQKLCQKTLNWHYVFRIACDSILYENGDRFQPKQLMEDPNEPFFFIPDVLFSEQKLENVAFLRYHEKLKYDDPLFLISNLDDPFDMAFAYDKRFAIETMFKDFKSRGFNLHKSRLKKTRAIFNLILVASLAFCFLMNFGFHHKNGKYHKKIQRTDKNTFSIFSFAQKLLQYFIERDIFFQLSLNFSMNCS